MKRHPNFIRKASSLLAAGMILTSAAGPVRAAEAAPEDSRAVTEAVTQAVTSQAEPEPAVSQAEPEPAVSQAEVSAEVSPAPSQTEAPASPIPSEAESPTPAPTVPPAETVSPSESPAPSETPAASPSVSPSESPAPGPEASPSPNAEPTEDPEATENPEGNTEYARYQGPAEYTLEGVGGVGREYIQNALIRMLYGGGSGYVSCDFDGYTNTAGRHEGIDFTAGKGTAIYALSDGYVTRVTGGADGGALSSIAIYDPRYDRTVVYLHAAPSESLAEGQEIRRGDFLGTESNRGATAAHTHVEVVTGYSRYANLSVNDYDLENEDPYYYWAAVLGNIDLEGSAAILDGVEYATLQEALDAAAPDSTVTLCRDVTESVTVAIRGLTLDLGGFALSAPQGEGIAHIAARGVTLQNGCITGTGLRYGVVVGGEGTDEAGNTVYYDAGGFTARDLVVYGLTMERADSDYIFFVESGGAEFQNVQIVNSLGMLVSAWNNAGATVFHACDFSSNASGAGRALVYVGASAVEFRDSVIADNRCGGDGTIYINHSGTLLLSNTAVTGNTAAGAGAIYAAGAELVLEDSVVTGNTGGAGVDGIDIRQGRFWISGGAVYGNGLVDVEIGPGAVGYLPAASAMAAEGVDFSACRWYRRDTGAFLDGEAALPDGYAAAWPAGADG